jgi:hypothetical protein
MDAGEKVSGELVVARCDGAKVLEFVEEALDEVALAIESEVARQRDRAAGMGGNDRRDLPVGEGLDEGIGVVGLVTDQSRWIGILEQGLCTSEVADLARRKHQLDGIAQGIDERVNFGAQSATRSADRLLAVFLRAPALC